MVDFQELIKALPLQDRCNLSHIKKNVFNDGEDIFTNRDVIKPSFIELLFDQACLQLISSLNSKIKLDLFTIISSSI